MATKYMKQKLIELKGQIQFFWIFKHPSLNN